MENLVVNSSFWRKKNIFLTGHTGFKGGWITHLLHELGAFVHGYSLEPPTQPNFFTETYLQKILTNSTIGDIRDTSLLRSALKIAKPDIIIHMAAQPLVLKSYNAPVETFETNVIGTISLLEAVRHTNSTKAIINITTDKCYANKEWYWPYRENDRLGGRDPYSASKACAEIATAAYRDSFLNEANIYLASARAGNVVGGGDWAVNRLIPDFFRALDASKNMIIRSPNALRPWQHVLEPLSGYLILAEKLYTKGKAFAEAWNFGPNENDVKSVSWIIKQLCKNIPEAKYKIENINKLHESGLLNLDSNKAKARLGWMPRWNLKTALNKTTEWHLAWKKKKNVSQVCRNQIQEYLKLEQNLE